jgi:PPK2 family polyphosphate:nucleotide phosphotransferase
MDIDRFRIAEGSSLNLDDHPADFSGDYTDKHEAEKDLSRNIARLRELQEVLYAQDKYSLLVIFQAMDAAGKDGAIAHVMTGVNPQGVSVVSFKQPSDEELSHDYLWRCARNLPERGRIGIFNRSHYEEVLVVRVHPAILQGQHLPDEIRNDPDIWQKRFRQICSFEQHLAENGTRIVKFFLNVSKDEQRRRFLSRIEEPEKNWKFSLGDVRQREHWNDYMAAYREAIEATSTAAAPWFVIPADKKWFSRLAVSEVIVQTLGSMDLHYPKVSEKQRQEIAEARGLLEAENA